MIQRFYSTTILCLCFVAFASAIQCPLSIDTALSGADCRSLVMSETCATTLRSLLETADATVPCTATLQTRSNPHVRRLAAMAQIDGKLKCKLDSPKPSNVSDWTQSFVLDCKEETSWTWLWWCLAFAGGYVVVWGAMTIYKSCSTKVAAWREAWRQRTIDVTEAEPTTNFSRV